MSSISYTDSQIQELIKLEKDKCPLGLESYIPIPGLEEECELTEGLNENQQIIHDWLLKQELGKRLGVNHEKNIAHLIDYTKKPDWKEKDGKLVRTCFKGKRTGKAVNLNNCKYLSVLDIDINHSDQENERMPEEEAEQLRKSIIDKCVEKNYVLRQTPSGGFHIYCNCTHEWTIRLIKTYGVKAHRILGIDIKKGLDLDLFTSMETYKNADYSKNNVTRINNITVCPTKVKYGDEIREDKWINGDYNSIVNYDITDVLKDFEWFDTVENHITKKVRDPKNKDKTIKLEGKSAKDYDPSSCKLSQSIIEKLVDGINYLEKIDTVSEGSIVEDVPNLHMLFIGILAIENDDLRCKAYENIWEIYKSTKTDRHTIDQFNHQKETHEESAYPDIKCLYLTIKYHASDFFSENIEPYLEKNFSSTTRINLKDTTFYPDTILEKCRRNSEHPDEKIYISKRQLAKDLVACFGRIENTTKYVRKIRDNDMLHLSVLEPISKQEFQDQLNLITIYLERTKTVKNKKGEISTRTYKEEVTGYQVFKDPLYTSRFTIKKDSPMLNSDFIGYNYDPDVMLNKMKTENPELTTDEIVEQLKETYLKEILPHFKRTLDDRFHNWWEDEKEKYRTHRKIGKLDLLYSKHKGNGKTIINRIFNELYGDKYVFKIGKITELLDPKHQGNIQGKQRLYVEEWDYLDGNISLNAMLRALISGVGKVNARVLFKNFSNIVNNVDIYAETNNLPTGLYEDNDEEDEFQPDRRIRGSIVPKSEIEDKDEKAIYFENLMKQIEPNGEGTGWNKEFFYALSTIMYYEKRDPNYKPHAQPKTNKFMDLLMLAAVGGEDYYNFTCIHVESLLKGISASMLANYVDRYIDDFHPKELKDKKEYPITSNLFIKKFNKCILKSKKATNAAIEAECNVAHGKNYYKFDSLEDAKKYLSVDRYEELKAESETPKLKISKIDSEIAKYKALLEKLENEKKITEQLIENAKNQNE